MLGSVMKPPAVIRAEASLGLQAVSWSHAPRGYTHNERWLVRWSDGGRAFVKAAVDDLSADWLRTEHRVYDEVSGSFLPRLLGWDDADPPVLVIEDLSDGHWPPPWSRDDVDAVVAALAALAATPPPAWVPSAEEWRDAGSWEVVARDPEPFLSLGLCTRAWFDSAVPGLLAATEATPFAGDALLHFDVRSDNICLQRDRALLVDWNWVAVGNPALDIAAWLPSLASEGGEPPRVPEADPFAAWVSGFFAARAGLAPPATAPRVREVQLAQLREALPWAAQVLDLPPLDHS
jgi:hypothetical protein